MRRLILVLILAGLASLMTACGDRDQSKGKPVVKVNDYVIDEDGFQRALARCERFHDITGLTLEDRKQILDELIRKELLIQAATKQKLDEDPEFRETIERYWEQTLISSLIKRQCAEAEKHIVVTAEEIEARCKEVAAGVGTDPASIPGLKEQVRKEIVEEKKGALLDQWTQELLKNAKIKVYKENL